MRSETRAFVHKISQTIREGTDDDLIALRAEVKQYLSTLPEEEVDEFVLTGVGEALEMACPPEAV